MDDQKRIEGYTILLKLLDKDLRDSHEYPYIPTPRDLEAAYRGLIRGLQLIDKMSPEVLATFKREFLTEKEQRRSARRLAASFKEATQEIVDCVDTFERFSSCGNSGVVHAVAALLDVARVWPYDGLLVSFFPDPEKNNYNALCTRFIGKHVHDDTSDAIAEMLKEILAMPYDEVRAFIDSREVKPKPEDLH